MTSMEAVRRRWYSSLVRVCDGAMTMDSPVWMPMGSKFSMLHTVMQLSCASRTTSYLPVPAPRARDATRRNGNEAGGRGRTIN